MPQGHLRRPGDELEDVDGAPGEGQGAARFFVCLAGRRRGSSSEQKRGSAGGGGQRPSSSSNSFSLFLSRLLSSPSLLPFLVRSELGESLALAPSSCRDASSRRSASTAASLEAHWKKNEN